MRQLVSRSSTQIAGEPVHSMCGDSLLNVVESPEIHEEQMGR